jgi:hypothetical protein
VLRVLCKLDGFLLNYIFKSRVKCIYQVWLPGSISKISKGGCLSKKKIIFAGKKVLGNCGGVGAGKNLLDKQGAIAKKYFGVTFATPDFVEQVGIRGVILEHVTVFLLNIDEISRFWG